MTNNFYPTIFAPVKVSERLPEDEVDVFANAEKIPSPKYKEMVVAYRENDKWISGDSNDYDNNPDYYQIKEWLEPLTNRYVFTKEELEKMWNTAYSKAAVDGSKAGYPNFEEYISSLK